MSAGEIRLDGWLAALFERPVFQVDASASEAGAEIARCVREHADQQQRAFYYSKVDTAAVPTVIELAAAGMFVVEVNVTFAIDAKIALSAASDSHAIPPALEIRESTAADAEDLLGVAATSFRYSRFHLDPFVGDDLANRIKREWIASYLAHQRGERLWTVRTGGSVAGFLAVIRGNDDDGRYTTIDLVAVAPRFQGRGIGRAIMSFFFQRYASSCDRLRVGTQVANLPSTRLYESVGMRIERAQHVLHMHVPGSRR